MIDDKKYRLAIASISLVLLIIGGLSAWSNKIQLLPTVAPPKITFSVQWPGAGEDFLISEIVKPYELALLGKMSNMRQVTVTTAPEKVTFEVEFDAGTDLMKAEQNIASLLSKARPLPLFVKPIEYHHGGRNVSNRVVGSYFITSENGQFNPEQMRFIADLATHKFKLSSGVDKVELNPILEQQLFVNLDIEKMYQYRLSYQMVRQRVEDVLSQTVTRLFEQESIITARFRQNNSLQDIAATPISHRDDTTLYLDDVATLKLDFTVPSAAVRFNGKPAIAMRILRLQHANLLDVQRGIDHVLQDNAINIASHGLQYHLSFDTSLFIERSIAWVVSSLLVGFMLSLAVSYFFFRRLQPTLFGALITLLSVAGVFIVLKIFAVSINVISLAGITFAIGMFVDGVLILVEQLDRLPLKERNSISSVQKAIKPLIPSLLASTFTTAIVFVPIILGEGSESQLFSGLSIAIVTGLCIALALTILIAPLFAKYLGEGRTSTPPLQGLWRSCARILNKPIRAVFSLVLLITVSIVGIAMLLPSLSYLPSVKRDAVDVYIPLSGQESIDKVENAYVLPLSDALEETGKEFDLKNSYVIAWNHFIVAAVRLQKSEDLPDLLNTLKNNLKPILPGQNVIVVQGELFGGLESTNNIKINLYVSDKKWLSENSQEMRQIIESHLPMTSMNFMPNISRPKKVYEFTTNVGNARRVGVTEYELKNLVRSFGQSDFIGKWNTGEQVVNAVLNMDATTSSLSAAPFVTASGNPSYIGELLQLEVKEELASLLRINGTPSAVINVRITDANYSTAEVINVLESGALPELKRFIGTKGTVDLQGSAASLTKAKLFLVMMLITILASFFCIVALLLRSVRLSLYVLASLPCSLFGGVLGFVVLQNVVGAELNVLTMLGFMIMLGVVANNAILLVDSINRGFQHSRSVPLALDYGIRNRSRAILISSLTTILGMLPLLTFPSESAKIYQGIAAIIVGGISANLLTVIWLNISIFTCFGGAKKAPQQQVNEANLLVDGDAQ